MKSIFNKMKIGILQYDIKLFKVEENIKKVNGFLENIKKMDVLF
jgi:hypothetical protein